MPVWMVVANVKAEAYGDASSAGTRHFSAGTRLWCLSSRRSWDGLWTIGLHRGSRRLVTVRTPLDRMTRFRARAAYAPAVLSRLRLPPGLEREPREAAIAALARHELGDPPFREALLGLLDPFWHTYPTERMIEGIGGWSRESAEQFASWRERDGPEPRAEGVRLSRAIREIDADALGRELMGRAAAEVEGFEAWEAQPFGPPSLAVLGDWLSERSAPLDAGVLAKFVRKRARHDRELARRAEKAREAATEALRDARGAHDRAAEVAALARLAEIEAGDPPLSRRWAQDALALAAPLDDPLTEARLWHTILGTHLAERSLEAFDRALSELAEVLSRVTQAEPELRGSLSVWANALDAAGDHDRAAEVRRVRARVRRAHP